MSNSITSLPSFFQSQGASTGKSSAKTTTAQDPISEFLAYQQLTPQEKIRDSFLKKFGMTEESLANLSSNKRADVEEEIRQTILKEFKGKMAEKGILLDISA